MICQKKFRFTVETAHYDPYSHVRRRPLVAVVIITAAKEEVSWSRIIGKKNKKTKGSHNKEGGVESWDTQASSDKWNGELFQLTVILYMYITWVQF